MLIQSKKGEGRNKYFFYKIKQKRGKKNIIRGIESLTAGCSEWDIPHDTGRKYEGGFHRSPRLPNHNG